LISNMINGQFRKYFGRISRIGFIFWVIDFSILLEYK